MSYPLDPKLKELLGTSHTEFQVGPWSALTSLTGISIVSHEDDLDLNGERTYGTLTVKEVSATGSTMRMRAGSGSELILKVPSDIIIGGYPFVFPPNSGPDWSKLISIGGVCRWVLEPYAKGGVQSIVGVTKNPSGTLIDCLKIGVSAIQRINSTTFKFTFSSPFLTDDAYTYSIENAPCTNGKAGDWIKLEKTSTYITLQIQNGEDPAELDFFATGINGQSSETGVVPIVYTVTATSSMTMSAKTMTAVGNVISWKGTSSMTMPVKTMVASGTYTFFHTGTSSMTVAVKTMAATGFFTFMGSGSSAMSAAAKTMSATGNVVGWLGTSSPSLAAKTMAGSGWISVHGTSAVSTAAKTMSASGTYTAPAAGITIEQQVDGTSTSSTSFSGTWTSTTISGRALFAAITIEQPSGVSNPSISVPSGWTKVSEQIQTNGTTCLAYILNSAARSGAETFTNSTSGSTTRNQVTLFEVSGLVSGGTLDVSTSATAIDTNAVTGTTGTTTANDEFCIGCIAGAINLSMTFATPQNSWTEKRNTGALLLGNTMGFDWYGVGAVLTKIVTATGAQATGETASFICQHSGSIATFK